MTEPIKNDLTGQKVGEYQIISRLGLGGMGVVYEGLQPVIGKRVAVKVLLPGLSHEPEVVKRFLAEARAVNSIGHRGIVDIFSFGELPDGSQYFVMEYLDGVPFNELIHESAPLPVHEVLRLLDQLLDALDAAHCAGIVHRDIKPSNIFLVDSGRQDTYVKVLDFGIAKLDLMTGSDTPQTHPSIIVGTPDYIAPEQARGQPVGPATDLYAVGCVAFELLTGKRPFKGDNPIQTMFMHVEQPAPIPSTIEPGIPAEVDALLASLLKKKPAERPASAAAVRDIVTELRASLGESKAVVAHGERPTQVGRAPTSRSALNPRPPSSKGVRSVPAAPRAATPSTKPPPSSRLGDRPPAPLRPRSPVPVRPSSSADETRVAAPPPGVRDEKPPDQTPMLTVDADAGAEPKPRPATPRPVRSARALTLDADADAEPKPATPRPVRSAGAPAPKRFDPNAVTTDEGATGKTPSLEEEALPPGARSRPWPVIAAGAFVLVAAGGGIVWFNQSDDPPEPPEQAATAKPPEPAAATPKPPEPVVATPKPTDPVSATPKPTDPVAATPKPPEPVAATPRPPEPVAATPKPPEPVAATPTPPEPVAATPKPPEPAVARPRPPPQPKGPTQAALLARIGKLEKRLAVKEDASGRADKVLRQFLAKARASASTAATLEERRELSTFLDELDAQIGRSR